LAPGAEIDGQRAAGLLRRGGGGDRGRVGSVTTAGWVFDWRAMARYMDASQAA
jgi:hypothetical protein